MVNLLSLLAVSVAALAVAATAGGRRKQFELVSGLVYAERPTGDLKADLYLPEGEGPFPGVVVIHGGGWSGGKPRQMRAVCRRLARRGYAAMNISYRFAPEHLYPAQVHDAKAAVRWLKTNAKTFRVDPERVGAFGYSAGAHLAMMLGVTKQAHGLEGDAPKDAPDTRIKAVAAGGLPARFNLWPVSPILTKFIGKPYAEAKETWEQASPVNHVSKDDPPTFLYHGRRDKLVEPRQAEIMMESLQAAGVPVELHWMSMRGHVLAFVFDGKAVRLAINFFDRHLKGD